jgi:hypothetical protein
VKGRRPPRALAPLRHHGFRLLVAGLVTSNVGEFLPASFSVIPSLLPGDDLQAGNALASGGTQLASLAGPAARNAGGEVAAT